MLGRKFNSLQSCLALPAVVFTLVFFASCSKDDSYNEPPVQPLNYSDSYYWIHADAMPTKEVDVFYVYPTVYLGPNMFADVTDPEVRDRARYMYDGQATAFETVGNMYAPYYRQTSIAIMEKTTEEKAAAFHREPLTDLIAAFEYFIDHYNNGRPFILAAHSQGSNIMMYFMSEYFSNGKYKDAYNRLVAAYLIGYNVTNDYLLANKHLKFATSANDTQVIISYNTEAPVIDGPNPLMADGVGVCINPLSWSCDKVTAPASLNLGTYCEDGKGGYVAGPGFADAQITDRGTIGCSTVNPDDYFNPDMPFPRGVYHGQDFPFYYFNLRANAQARVDAYFGR